MPPERIVKAGVFTIAALGVFLVVMTISALKELRFIGSGVAATNTISVTGEGEVFAVPDLATFSVAVQETAKDVQTAQTTATKKNNDIVAYLKSAGVEDRDIQTSEYNIYPQYEYSREICTSTYCGPGKQTLTGYQVSQTLTVKVRKTDKAGEILAGVGSKGATNVSGLSFTIDDEDALQAEARGKAIADAKTKADELAKQLGVHVVRIVGFSENGNYPMYYAKAEMSLQAADARGSAANPAPALPTGENKITSNVSVTYEIR